MLIDNKKLWGEFKNDTVGQAVPDTPKAKENCDEIRTYF